MTSIIAVEKYVGDAGHDRVRYQTVSDSTSNSTQYETRNQMFKRWIADVSEQPVDEGVSLQDSLVEEIIILQDKIYPVENIIFLSRTPRVGSITALDFGHGKFANTIFSEIRKKSIAEDNVIPASRNAAERFVYKHDFSHIQHPHVLISEDGEVTFYWNSKACKILLSFDERGNYYYYANNYANDVAYGGEDLDYTINLPNEVLALISDAG